MRRDLSTRTKTSSVAVV